MNELFQRYNFTLCVTKKESRSCDSVKVTIKSGRIPTFQLSARDTRVDPSEDLIVKCLVSGAKGTCVRWTCDRNVGDGFSEIDLAAVSDSAEEICFDRSNNKRGFHLYVPKNSLEPGNKYQFRIVGKSDTGGIGEATTGIEVMVTPNEGNCEVTRTVQPRFNELASVLTLLYFKSPLSF